MVTAADIRSDLSESRLRFTVNDPLAALLKKRIHLACDSRISAACAPGFCRPHLQWGLASRARRIVHIYRHTPPRAVTELIRYVDPRTNAGPVKRLFLRLWNSAFVRNVAIVAGGTAAAQVISVATSPVVTRLYSPAAFGVLGIFTALVSTLSQLSTLGYHTAVVIPKDEREGRTLLWLSLGLSAGFAAAIAGILMFTHASVANVLSFDVSSAYLMLVPVAVLASSMVETQSQWLVRKDRFRPIASGSVFHSVFSSVAKIGIGFVSATGVVLISVVTAAHALKATWFSLVAYRTGVAERTTPDRTSSGLRPWREVAREYRDFPIFQLPTSFADRLGQAAPTIILAAFFGPAFAGFYELARRIIKLPSQLIARSLDKVYRSRAAKAVHEGRNLSKDLLRTGLWLFLVGAIPYGIIIGFGPFLFEFVFGSEWAIAGRVARWLAMWYLFHIAMSPANQALRVTRHLPFRLGWAVGDNGAKVLTLLIVASVSGQPLVTIAAYAAIGIITDAALIGLAAYKTRSFSSQ